MKGIGGDSSGGRLLAVDVARVAAAASVVGLHVVAPAVSGPGDHSATGTVKAALFWSVACFFTLAGNFDARESRRTGPGRAVGRRTGRLLVPLAVWSALYALLRLAEGVPLARDDVAGAALFGMAYSHLWFLEALFACAAIVAAFEWLGWSLDALWKVSVCAAVAYAFVGWPLFASHPHDTVTLWLYRSPAFWMAFYLFGHRRPSEGRRAALPAALLALAAAWTAPGLVALGSASAAIGLRWLAVGVAGACAADLALRGRRRTRPLTASLAGSSMGVYLIHPAILMGLRYWSATVWPPLALVAALSGSLIATWLIGRIPGVRAVLLGEAGQRRPAGPPRPRLMAERGASRHA